MLSPGGASKPPPPCAPEGELNATWEMWDIVRSVCDYNSRLTLSESPHHLSQMFETDD